MIFTTFVIAIEEKRPRLLIITAFLLVIASADAHWLVFAPMLFFNYIIISTIYLIIYSKLSKSEIGKEVIIKLGLTNL